ncbi:hypothetical protein Scep_028308 [Stephania cephalantha]|uniref:Uncharacterized protein n=1 Tax=Stephania cephalantha TaxID=152367 RepID=A0AAP0E9Q7_9MAGN
MAEYEIRDRRHIWCPQWSMHRVEAGGLEVLKMNSETVNEAFTLVKECTDGSEAKMSLELQCRGILTLYSILHCLQGSTAMPNTTRAEFKKVMLRIYFDGTLIA